jgi:hypothetical protein
LGRLALGRGWEGLWLNYNWVWPEAIAIGLQLVGWLTAVLLAAGMIWIGRQFVGQMGQARDAGETTPAQPNLNGFVLVWALSAPILFMLPDTTVYTQYQLVSLPRSFCWPARRQAGGPVGGAGWCWPRPFSLRWCR